MLIGKKVVTDYLDGVNVDHALTIGHQEISGKWSKMHYLNMGIGGKELKKYRHTF